MISTKNRHEKISNSPSHVPIHELPTETLVPTHDLLRIQLQGSASRDQLQNPPALPPHLRERDIDYSVEAVRTTALKYAAEILPEEISQKLKIDHDILDSISVSKPPTLEGVMLLAGAWDNVRSNSDETLSELAEEDNNKIGAALAASLDFLTDRETRDMFGQAFANAYVTGESILAHYHLERANKLIDIEDVPSVTVEGEFVPYYNLSNPAYDPYAPNQDNILVSRADMMIVPEEIRKRVQEKVNPVTDSEGTVQTDMSQFLND
ncbi:hypothetical protein I8H89_01905 [Candidatus Saccharibacteria bacterium]|nr:hypothetical protein [Candidatus Saccharibacteria bacterium]